MNCMHVHCEPGAVGISGGNAFKLYGRGPLHGPFRKLAFQHGFGLVLASIRQKSSYKKGLSHGHCAAAGRGWRRPVPRRRQLARAQSRTLLLYSLLVGMVISELSLGRITRAIWPILAAYLLVLGLVTYVPG